MNNNNHSQPLQRLPRGFAAAAMGVSTTNSNSPRATRIEREKEKERTKLRERHRRAITSRMLNGFRQYGNFPLPARADMNDVLAALARQAGWTVESDGTTFRQSTHSNKLGACNVTRSVESPVSSGSLKSYSVKASIDFPSSVLEIDDSRSPVSLDSIAVSARGGSELERYSDSHINNSDDCLETDQLMQDGFNYIGTAYVPVYVMLGTGLINKFCQLVDRDAVRKELRFLKSLRVDGVFVDCWWGIVESQGPQKYCWSGYRELFNIIHEFELKLQVGLAFHEYGGNDNGEIPVSLPQWVLDIGKENNDIFFTDREGRRNTECLSWGIDKERVFKGRSGAEVYFDVMRSFRTEFDDMFIEGLITGIEIGLGPAGELKYPSFSEKMGWSYPGIGEFQCYDKYMQESLCKASNLRGHDNWGRCPENAGSYNSHPHETGFFCEKGDYDSYYGRFFLRWYAQSLIDHANTVLSLANLAFEEIQISVKIPGVYWWYKSTSHAAELTAGYYNPANQDGYSALFQFFKKYSVVVKFVCSGVHLYDRNYESLADPKGLTWQVLNSAWDVGLTVAGQNASPCYDKEVFMRLVETAKPSDDPDHHHFAYFTFQPPIPLVERTIFFSELDHFIGFMHGDNVGTEM
ncbi:beta-amylase 8 [Rutidosis leptorrhynchoides]|uniref:beta-amylase 8 n=1 Tax=Rutidosis leptorrhynchoides TaxID=125765 RepID=UPI003A99C517